MKAELINKKYTLYKNKIETVLTELIPLTDKLEMIYLSVELKNLFKSLESPFMFVVIGEVKSGKSSFINTLTGENICGVDMETIKLARQIFIILASTTLFRAINITIVVGLLRSGGDTVFILGLDLFSQWGVGILLTYLCAFVWHQPLPVVFLAINSEEIVKFFICSYRYLSRKWLRNLVT